MAHNAELPVLLDEADRRVSATGGVPHNDFWERFDQGTPADRK